MQLTKHTDYAFRVLIFLTAQTESKLSTIQEITDTFDISRNHLMKIVNKLAHAGIIHTVRGQQGGIKLGHPPQKISLRSIVELMEVTLNPVNCHTPRCKINQYCHLSKILIGAQNQYLEYLEEFNLVDLQVQPEIFLNMFSSK